MTKPTAAQNKARRAEVLARVAARRSPLPTWRDLESDRITGTLVFNHDKARRAFERSSAPADVWARRNAQF
jgi:hypothetical protein